MHKDFAPEAPIAGEISFDDFLKVDIRVGRIVRAETFPEARKPAYRLWIDFGPAIGEKKSAAQITVHYATDDLVGRRVMAVVNFPPRQIGPVRSEVLVLGFADEDGAIRLAAPDGDVPLGARMA
ncbi:tRNA-binding protein [Hyphobacterium sp.]|uniref:tRNA-binding protein n=1 Tax=Hyphobacterium sp. TaxID=2004662 RepID=UPI003B5181BF